MRKTPLSWGILATLIVVGCDQSKPTTSAEATPTNTAASPLTDQVNQERDALNTDPLQVDSVKTESSLADPLQTVRQNALERSVSAFLIENNKDPNNLQKHAFANLNEDTVLDALVILGPPDWCIPGGCTLLVFQGQGDGTLTDGTDGNEFRLISTTTLVDGPLTITDDLTQGWRDMVLRVAEEDEDPKRVVLKFDGQGYPSDPTVLDPLPKDAQMQGVEVLPWQEPFQTLGSTPVLAAACRGAIATQIQTPPDTIVLKFARTSEADSAYVYTLAGGRTGTCHVRYDGKIVAIQ